jgi:hypothetical protein
MLMNRTLFTVVILINSIGQATGVGDQAGAA